MTRDFACLEVTGLELEYPIVGPDLGIRRVVPGLLAHLAGDGASDARIEGVGLSNEFVDHLLEVKNELPLATLDRVEAELATGVAALCRLLRERFDAMLLPLGMHPTMAPADAALWSGEGHEIYATYARLFDVVQHGWTNVQSCHVNLPFGAEADCARMMNAVALLVPYLPAIAASSPFREGVVAEALDQRLADLAALQARVPESGGVVVPEYMRDYADYRATVLDPMFKALDAIPGAELLRHDFFNSRGAVLKFSRTSLEVRVLDVQECPKMDVALAAFVRASVRVLMEAQREPGFRLPEHGRLVQDYRATVREGRGARVFAPHLGGPARAGVVLERLLERAQARATPDEVPYLGLAAKRLSRGTLSERLRARAGVRCGERVPATTLREIAFDLARGLEANSPYDA